MWRIPSEAVNKELRKLFHLVVLVSKNSVQEKEMRLGAELTNSFINCPSHAGVENKPSANYLLVLVFFLSLSKISALSMLHFLDLN